MIIKCKLHGTFYQNYINHISLKCGCPYCNSSKGKQYIKNLLDKNNIKYISQYRFSNCKDKKPLPFDFYIEDKNLVIEYDGKQHFEPIGFGGNSLLNFELVKKHDNIKNEYCKNNNINLLRIKYSDNIENKLSKFFNLDKKQINNELVNYIYNKIKDISFPYDICSDYELKKDFEELIKNCKKNTGLKIVKHFHPNIYTSYVKNINMVDAWNNEKLLKRCIENRLRYIGENLSPKKIRDGLNISKIAPKVSVFRPNLARYLVDKYLKEYNIVFDPFSGFSGRMLGVCSLGKKYIGQDINPYMVIGSNKIIDLFNINADASRIDLFNSSGEYDCLFTCSPYNLKERWGQEIKNLSCDEWIDECLKRFKCKKYLFVVDKTEKYKNNIVEEISNISHFGKNTEKVILL